MAILWSLGKLFWSDHSQGCQNEPQGKPQTDQGKHGRRNVHLCAKSFRKVKLAPQEENRLSLKFGSQKAQFQPPIFFGSDFEPISRNFPLVPCTSALLSEFFHQTIKTRNFLGIQNRIFFGRSINFCTKSQFEGIDSKCTRRWHANCYASEE